MQTHFHFYHSPSLKINYYVYIQVFYYNLFYNLFYDDLFILLPDFMYVSFYLLSNKECTECPSYIHRYVEWCPIISSYQTQAILIAPINDKETLLIIWIIQTNNQHYSIGLHIEDDTIRSRGNQASIPHYLCHGARVPHYLGHV